MKEIQIDLAEDFTFEELLDAAADQCRGRQMTEEEWEYHRHLWAGLGMCLAPCRPGSDLDFDDDLEDTDAFDRAMAVFE